MRCSDAAVLFSAAVAAAAGVSLILATEGMGHGETCSQICKAYNHGIGISRLEHTEDHLELHPNPWTVQACPATRAMSDLEGRVSRLQASNTMFAI